MSKEQIYVKIIVMKKRFFLLWIEPEGKPKEFPQPLVH